MAEIKCTVNKCKYWRSNICTASTIEVGGNGVSSDMADSSTKTQCVTMQKK